jgi:hypothetical protein
MNCLGSSLIAVHYKNWGSGGFDDKPDAGTLEDRSTKEEEGFLS